jgi:hypothetical protein
VAALLERWRDITEDRAQTAPWCTGPVGRLLLERDFSAGR